MQLQDISSIIQNIAVIIASVIAIIGVNAWRKETKWKKKYELAEETLALFYEVNEKFKIIRNPFGYIGEGRSRKRNENETSAESEILDNAYVFFERWEKEKEPFIKLQTLKFRFIAVFGKEYKEPFDEITKLMNEILFASQRLGQRYWKNQGRKQMEGKEFEAHLKEMHEFEAKIWYHGDEDDTIQIRLNNTIMQIENLYQKVLRK